ncbi:MAG: enoyl-CoA hydratase/isomerase family protein [Acidobacteriota bacterium]
MTHSQPTFILTDREDSILTLTLNRADKSNSLHPDLVRQLSEAIAAVESDEEISVLVITGAGRSFCAGLDLELLAVWSVEEKIAYLETVTGLFNRIWNLPQPVIAAVNGAAIAGGFDLAAFCDIRLAAPEAVFGQAEIDLGLTQIIHPLYKSIGLGRAKELALTGQNISAEEAYRIGLANHVYPREELMSRAMEMARLLAGKPRQALFETKRLSRELIDYDTERAMKEMVAAISRCLASSEHQKRTAEVFDQMKRR